MATFFFSKTQKEMGGYGTVRLSKDEVVEYSEYTSEDNSDGAYPEIKVRPFLERFPDGKILGDGKIVSTSFIRSDMLKTK